MRCDAEGVPTLVQKISYNYGHMTFKVYFFNGYARIFNAESVCPSLGLMDSEPTKMQWLEAESNIEKYVLKNYGFLFPRLRLQLVARR